MSKDITQMFPPDTRLHSLIGAQSAPPQSPQPAPALAYSFADVQSMARVIVEGNLFPSLRNPAQVLSLMLLCQAKGMHPMAAVERYHIIEGKPSMKADAMLSEFLSHGGRIEWQERSDVRVSATFTAPNAGTVEVCWTIERAQRAGLTGKGNWKSYPCQMLSARTISEGIGLTMPGVRMGIYTPEETMDFTPPPVYQPSSLERALASPRAPQPKALDAAPIEAPRISPFRRFIIRARELNITPPVVTPGGKLSQKGALALLSECYGTEVVELPMLDNHEAWEANLAALLAVYPEAPSAPADAMPEKPAPVMPAITDVTLDDLSDPFADDAEGAEPTL